MWSVHPEGRGSAGASSPLSLQGCHSRQDTHPDQPQYRRTRGTAHIQTIYYSTWELGIFNYYKPDTIIYVDGKPGDPANCELENQHYDSTLMREVLSVPN